MTPTDPFAALSAERTIRDAVDSLKVTLENSCECGKKNCCTPEPDVFSLIEVGVSEGLAQKLLSLFDAYFEYAPGKRRTVLVGPWEVDPTAVAAHQRIAGATQ